jgi:hypothetical protein
MYGKARKKRSNLRIKRKSKRCTAQRFQQAVIDAKTLYTSLQ